MSDLEETLIPENDFMIQIAFDGSLDQIKMESDDDSFSESSESEIESESESDDENVDDDDDGKKKKKSKKNKNKKNKKKDKDKEKSKSKEKNEDGNETPKPPKTPKTELEKALKAGAKACLEAHNQKRSLHKDTPMMTLSKKLCEEAQEWVEELAAKNEFYHAPDTKGCGENLYGHGAPKAPSLTKTRCAQIAKSAVGSWYNEIKNYSYETYGKINPDKQIGHFTQLVWKNSLKLGVGIAIRADTKWTLVVCRYSPAGNVAMSSNLPDQVAPLI